MKRIGLWKLLAALAVAVLLPSSASAVIQLQPPGLAAGQTYHLAFVTKGTRDGSSPNNADYDGFVQAAANAAANGLQNFTWYAVGSTDAVAATAHINISGGVYRLDGTFIASSHSDFFDGTLAAPINQTEVDDYFIDAGVLSGSTANGGQFAGATLGSSNVRFGGTGAARVIDSTWLDRGITISSGAIRQLYAISGPIVAIAIPEPSGFVLAASFACAIMALKRRS